jgi:hypothetical protein
VATAGAQWLEKVNNKKSLIYNIIFEKFESYPQK